MVKLSIQVLFLIAGTMTISLASEVDRGVPIIKEYTNAKMGFELNYPATWTVSEDSKTSVSLRKFLKKRNQVVFISFFLQKNINPKALPIYDWYKKMLVRYKKNGAKPPESSNTKLGGRPVVLLKSDGSLGVSYNYYWSLNTDILSMSFSPDKDINDDINKIISTIKIHDPN